MGKINGFYYNHDAVWAKVLHFPNDVGPYMMWKQRDLDDLYTPFRTGSTSQREVLAQDIIASMFSDEFIMWLPESCCIWHTHRDSWVLLNEKKRDAIYETFWTFDENVLDFYMEMSRDEVRSPDNDDEQIKFINKAFVGAFILDPKHTLFLCPQYMIDGTDTNDPVLVGMDRNCMVVVWRE